MLNFDYFLFSKKNDFFQEICRILAYNLISFAILKRYEKYKSDALLELSKYSPKNLILIKKLFTKFQYYIRVPRSFMGSK